MDRIEREQDPTTSVFKFVQKLPQAEYPVVLKNRVGFEDLKNSRLLSQSQTLPRLRTAPW